VPEKINGNRRREAARWVTRPRSGRGGPVLGWLLVMVGWGGAQGRLLEVPISPDAIGSGQPNLSVSKEAGAEEVALSWIERRGEGRHRLRMAILGQDGWEDARTIAEGENWFVNWADFPSLRWLGGKAWAAHWLVKSGPETFDYDVWIGRSFDGGTTWERPLIPHRDGVKAEHGFVSLLPVGERSLGAVWLDGREMKAHHPGSKEEATHGPGNMTLRYAQVDQSGRLSEEAILDDRVCECCQTSAAISDQGPLVVYRDRSAEEIRDISLVRRVKNRWTAPRPVSVDGWKIEGCPVNGPVVAAQGSQVAVAWFTMAGERAQVRLAFSADSGEHFQAPLTVDEGMPIGRVDLLLLEDGTALVSWIEKQETGGAILVRRLRPDGSRGISLRINSAETARATGFPKMARQGANLVMAWTSGRVVTTVLPLSAIPGVRRDPR
jgi:hypothetical protein